VKMYACSTISGKSGLLFNWLEREKSSYDNGCSSMVNIKYMFIYVFIYIYIYICWPANSGPMKLHFLLSTVTEFCNYVRPEDILTVAYTSFIGNQNSILKHLYHIVQKLSITCSINSR